MRFSIDDVMSEVCFAFFEDVIADPIESTWRLKALLDSRL